MAKTGCLVVGGGLIGLLSALELSSRGFSVRVLERNAEPGQESSWAGGGILSPLYPWRYDEAVNLLAAWGQQHYPALAEKLLAETGLDPQWRKTGMLVLDDCGEQAQTWAKQHDMPAQYLQGVALREVEPSLSAHYTDGLYFPELAQIRNPRLVKSLVKYLKAQGVDFLTGCDVQRVVAHNGRVAGVMTARGEIRAPKVVIAGGAWTAQLLEGMGVNLRITPVRGQMLLFHGRPDMIKRILLDQGQYVIPRQDGRVLVGSTIEQVGFDKSITDVALELLRGAAFRMVPELESCELEQQWAGLRPGTPDGIPVIGAHEAIEGLYINSGHYRNGVVMGLGSARLLADIMCGEQPVIDPAAYQPQVISTE